jgi:DNA-binding MarR family transcriptional regulator
MMARTEAETSLAETAQRLRTAVTRLNRRLRSSSLGGVSPAQASALAMIDRLGSPSLGELAAAEQVQPPTITRLVASLERDGLVQRRVDGEDRRCLRVTLTASGRRELSSIRVKKAAFIEQRLARLEDDELDAVVRVIGILERWSEEP